MSKLLTNQISNYNDNGPVEVKDGINVASGKPLQIAGANGTSGDYLKSTGSSVAWTTFPTIPAAQVNTDWNATSGITQILNKPTLAAVATSGSYNDLLNQPTIPAAQIQSNWTQSNSAALDFIKNKPSLFDGQYSSLTGAPSVPATLNDLADVNIPSPNDNLYIKWDANTNRWVQGSGSAGISNIVEDATPQLGGTLDANGQEIDMGVNNISDAGVGNWNTAYSWGNHANAGYLTSDANTTYSQQSIQDNADVKLRLTDSGGTNDDIKITAGTNITFTAVGSSGFTINSSGGGSSGATVTTDDTAPSSPSDGDLWWKSDEGRLKVFYQDPNSSQWVDANPPLASTSINNGTTNGTNGVSTTTSTSGSNANAIEIKTDNGTTSANRWRFVPNGHLIPSSNADYDIGNAEYKVRHLFLSDNTVYFQGDFLKVAQHNSGGSAQSPSYLIPLSRLKAALNASSSFDDFKNAILAITDA